MKVVSGPSHLEATQHRASAFGLFAKKQLGATAPHPAWVKRFSGL
jgi:hypothetical protein